MSTYTCQYNLYILDVLIATCFNLYLFQELSYINNYSIIKVNKSIIFYKSLLSFCHCIIIAFFELLLKISNKILISPDKFHMEGTL